MSIIYKNKMSQSFWKSFPYVYMLLNMRQMMSPILHHVMKFDKS